jgi:hypothetical protein
VVLHSLRADDLQNDESVSWRVYEGAASAAPRFDGSDRFQVAGVDGDLFGTIAAGRVVAKDGTVNLRVPLFPDQPPVELPLAAARVEVDLQGDRCEGKIGGAILSDDLTRRVLPAIAEQLITHVSLRPEHELSIIVIDLFDANDDGVLTVAEVLADPIVAALTAPDVDMSHDGERDAYSVALGFTCVAASFDAAE